MANLPEVDLLRNGSLNRTLDTADSELNRISNYLMIGSMFVTMVSLGCTMEVTKIKDHIVKPKGVGIALVAQFGIMPLTAFILAKVFQLSEMAAVVVLICGCCPGGLLSNVTSLVIKGDMNLSIVMTTCSTLLALGMMPLLLLVYCQGIEGLQEAVPYGDIALTLLTIVFPCGIGILLNHYRPQYSNFIRKAGLTVSSIGFLVVIGLTILDNGDEALGVLAPSIVAIAVLMPITGYTLGYLLSLLFRLTQPECRTVSMETGCQNAGLAMTVIKVVFPPEAVGPLVLFPVAYVLTQLSEALLLVLLFRTHLHWQQRKNKKGVYQAASPEMQEVGVSEKSC